MDRAKDLLRWDRAEDREAVAKALGEGQLVIGSTDTVLGFFADVSAAGFKALNGVKAREDKPYLLLMKDAESAHQYVEEPMPAYALALMQYFWPGPLTLMFRAKKEVPSYMVSAAHTIAIRIPKHEGIQTLLSHFPQGLFSTSANLSGKPVAKKVQELDPVLMREVAHVIVDDHAEADTPSTIVDCTGDHPRIVREGAITVSDIHAVLRV